MYNRSRESGLFGKIGKPADGVHAKGKRNKEKEKIKKRNKDRRCLCSAEINWRRETKQPSPGPVGPCL